MMPTVYRKHFIQVVLIHGLIYVHRKGVWFFFHIEIDLKTVQGLD
jgi:hypothetical protein